MEIELSGAFSKNVVLEDESGGQFTEQVVYEWGQMKCKGYNWFGYTLKDCKGKQEMQIW